MARFAPRPKEVIFVFKTRITELFGIDYPIVQGGLQWLGRSRLAAAVSEAGGLGLITAGSYASKGEFVADLRRARELTQKPVGVNISLGIRRQMDEFFAAAIEEQVRIVFTSGRNPEPYVSALKSAGVTLVHVVPAVRYARKAQDIGADAVVIVGFEAGGHPGMDDVGSLALLPRAVDELQIPVIAAGGFADGRGLVAALALGAEGVQMGTRFVLSEECEVHPNVKAALLAARETDTLMIERSIRNAARVLDTGTARRVLELEFRGAGIDELLPLIGGEGYVRAVEQGDLEAGVISCGQGVGLMKEVRPVGEIISSIIEEARRAVAGLQG